MEKIEVRKISEDEARGVFKQLLIDHSDQFLQRFFRDAFQDEFNHIALPEKERSYSVVSANGFDEALFGIREISDQPSVWSISAMGRIIQKDKTEGWQYLKAILDFAIEGGVKIINATVNDAGEKAFRELQNNGGLQRNCRMEWSPRGDKKAVRLLME
ncbi:MAG: hypothetical protein ABSB22_12305 [Thermodesulfobacteriota bacterium]